MESFSLDPEAFERVWQRVSAGRDGPIALGRPTGAPPGSNRPPTPPPPGPNRPPVPPSPGPNRPPAPSPGQNRPPAPPPGPSRPPVPLPPGPNRPPAPPLGPQCRENEALLRGLIDQELERSRSAQTPYLPARLSAQALSRAKRLAAALYLICGRWYLPRQSRRERWRSRREALRSLYRQSQTLEERYRRSASSVKDPELRSLFRELADECAAEQQFLRHQLEL